MNNNNSVNLSKPVSSQREPWTDPVTGEIYPGGNPNEVSSAPQSAPNAQAYQPFPESTVPTMQPTQTIYPSAFGVAGQNQMQPTQFAQPQQVQQPQTAPAGNLKYCKFCGARIPMDAVVCTHCGRQVEMLQSQQNNQPIVINNTTTQSNNQNVVVGTGRPKNKLTAVLLCLFLGEFGVHRFYEGKILTGLLWMFTVGLFGIGWLVDLIILLCKPSTYYV